MSTVDRKPCPYVRPLEWCERHCVLCGKQPAARLTPYSTWGRYPMVSIGGRFLAHEICRDELAACFGIYPKPEPEPPRSASFRRAMALMWALPALVAGLSLGPEPSRR